LAISSDTRDLVSPILRAPLAGTIVLTRRARIKLYHFTSSHHLHGIALHGLTVGDVPTDLASNQGRCGVWLTSNMHPNGHGLEGSAADKSKYRLTVDAPDNGLLVKWVNWSAKHVTPQTIRDLHSAAAKHGAVTFDDWYVYFGVIDRSAIQECVDTQTGEAVENWQDRTPSPLDVPPVPAWRRKAWHRKLLKEAAKTISRQARSRT
jgi:hypothetical protein